MLSMRQLVLISIIFCNGIQAEPKKPVTASKKFSYDLGFAKWKKNRVLLDRKGKLPKSAYKNCKDGQRRLKLSFFAFLIDAHGKKIAALGSVTLAAGALIFGLHKREQNKQALAREKEERRNRYKDAIKREIAALSEKEALNRKFLEGQQDEVGLAIEETARAEMKDIIIAAFSENEALERNALAEKQDDEGLAIEETARAEMRDIKALAARKKADRAAIERAEVEAGLAIKREEAAAWGAIRTAFRRAQEGEAVRESFKKTERAAFEEAEGTAREQIISERTGIINQAKDEILAIETKERTAIANALETIRTARRERRDAEKSDTVERNAKDLAAIETMGARINTALETLISDPKTKATTKALMEEIRASIDTERAPAIAAVYTEKDAAINAEKRRVDDSSRAIESKIKEARCQPEAIAAIIKEVNGRAAARTEIRTGFEERIADARHKTRLDLERRAMEAIEKASLENALKAIKTAKNRSDAANKKRENERIAKHREDVSAIYIRTNNVLKAKISDPGTRVAIRSIISRIADEFSDKQRTITRKYRSIFDTEKSKEESSEVIEIKIKEVGYKPEAIATIIKDLNTKEAAIIASKNKEKDELRLTFEKEIMKVIEEKRQAKRKYKASVGTLTAAPQQQNTAAARKFLSAIGLDPDEIHSLEIIYQKYRETIKGMLPARGTAIFDEQLHRLNSLRLAAISSIQSPGFALMFEAPKHGPLPLATEPVCRPQVAENA